MKLNTERFETQSKPGTILKLALLQLLGTTVFSLVLYYCFDSREAISAFLGGGIASISSVFLAGRLFSAKANTVAAEMLMRFYISVVLKIIFVLAMMAICIVVIEVSILPFIIAFVLAAVIINWLFLFFYKVPVYQ